MLAIHDYFSTLILGKEPQLSSFHLFSSLPPELRRKIWHFALPSRLVEVAIWRNSAGVWGYDDIKTQDKVVDKRRQHLPQLFSINVESREYCLETYIPFADTYIHPTLDLLYISWITELPGKGTFREIRGKPFQKLDTVSMTLARNGSFPSDGRFGAIKNCLRDLGAPKEILLCLIGSHLPSSITTMSGFSLSTGAGVNFVEWYKEVANSSQTLHSHIIGDLEQLKAADSSFQIPTISKTLHYVAHFSENDS